MKNVLIIGLILFHFSKPAQLFSQELHVSLESGIGSYKMSDLKKFNDLVLSFLPFEVKITEDFPIYLFYKPSLIYSFPKALSVGIVWSYQSTGSRISRVDYSGEYYLDNKIRASSPGILVQVNFTINKFKISLFNEAGLEFSKLEMNEYLKIGTEAQNDEYTFTSINIYDEPGIKISYPISNFKVGLVAGYLIDLKNGEFSYSGHDNLILNISDGKQATADWTGIRLGVSILYILFQKSK